jgi:predicted TIM-barrel fold metal-dependent hydrolase
MAVNGFRVFDADLHISEPPDLWQRYIEPKYRDRAPVLAPTIGDFREMNLLIDGKAVTPSGKHDKVWGFSTKCAHHFGRYELFMDYERRGWGPDTEIDAMDAEGIDTAVLFPTAGLCVPAQEYDDNGFALAIARAYNDWLAEFCAYCPERLYGAAMVMPHDIGATVAEVRRAKRELGFKGIYIRPNPIRGRNWQDPAYDPLWKTCEEEGVVVGFHGGMNCTLPQAVAERFDWSRDDAWLTSHVACHPVEMMYAMLCMVMGGVLERFPELRVAFLEANFGWVPYYLWRMDEHYELRREVTFEAVKDRLPLRPSEYFKRQCYASIEAEERFSCPVVGELADRIIFSTDFPHPECPFPNGVRKFLELPMDYETKRRILWENPCQLYRMAA